MKIKIIRHIVLFSCLFLALFIRLPQTFGYSASDDCINIGIKDISYLENSTYKITISLMNISRQKVSLAGFKKKYFAQSEMLGQWIKLADYPDAVFIEDGNSSLSPAEDLEVNSFVKIQSNIPSLYLNGFGEVNLKFSYHLDILCGKKMRSLSLSGEKLYWITLKTNKWTLREGM